MWAEYIKIGVEYQQRPAGRLKDSALSEEIRVVFDGHHCRPEGVIRTAKRLQKEGHDANLSKVYQVMKSNSLVVVFPAKSKKQK